MVYMLPLTAGDLENILDAKLFAGLPQGAWVMNMGRGGHCKEGDLLAALNCGPSWAARCWTCSRPIPCPPTALLDSSQRDGDAAYRRASPIRATHRPLWWIASARAETGAPFKNVVDLNRGY